MVAGYAEACKIMGMEKSACLPGLTMPGLSEGGRENWQGEGAKGDRFDSRFGTMTEQQRKKR